LCTQHFGKQALGNLQRIIVTAITHQQPTRPPLLEAVRPVARYRYQDLLEYQPCRGSRTQLFRTEYEGSMPREHYGLPGQKASSMIPPGQQSRCSPLPAYDRRPTGARDSNRDETLDLATDVLVMGGEPSAGWAALDTAAASARINSTGASGQTMTVLD
jgi:hypothetical protein